MRRRDDSNSAEQELPDGDDIRVDGIMMRIGFYTLEPIHTRTHLKSGNALAAGYLWDSLARLSPGAGDEYHLINAVPSMAAEFAGRYFRKVYDRIVRPQGMARAVFGWAGHRRAIRSWLADAQRRLGPVDGIVLFTPPGFVGTLDINVPAIVFWDAPDTAFLDYASAYGEVFTPDHLAALRKLELAGLAKAKGVVMPCAWSAAQAVQRVPDVAKRLHVVPYGSNLPHSATPSAEALAARPLPGGAGVTCRLVFIDTAWRRKGGDIAVQTVVELKKRGIPAELTVIGDGPKGGDGVRESGVRVTGFIDSRTPDGVAKLAEIMTSSHFYLLPSRGDVIPASIREAQFYGVPVVCSAVGALPEMVQDGVDGMVVATLEPKEYADRIAAVWTAPGAYQSMTAKAFARGRAQTWDTTALRFVKVVQAILKD